MTVPLWGVIALAYHFAARLAEFAARPAPVARVEAPVLRLNGAALELILGALSTRPATPEELEQIRKLLSEGRDRAR